MKKIAVLRCLRVSASCAGSGCLRAMNEKTGAFERYGDEDLQAVAFFTCNGCKENKLPNQEGMAKKVERIKKLNPDALHLSNCTMPKDEDGNRVICPVIKELEDEFVAAGINVEHGTHGFDIQERRWLRRLR